MTHSMVKLNHVVKVFDDDDHDQSHAAVNDISLEIMEGEFLTILGPSGCGKTTTLRMIAGFEKCTQGNIYIDGEDVSSKPPYERQVNTVFQSYALFPHMNIYDNIAFGLNLKKVSKTEIDRRVKEMLKMVQLEGMEKRMPDQLSGGQKQRVAIARAIINKPKVLLLDEPLGALDQKLRKQMQVELKHLQKQLGITFIFVTHDQEEALTMSNRICIMNNGKIEQVGTPDEIYERPATRFVADFIGETNIFEARFKGFEKGQVQATLEDGQDVLLDKSTPVGNDTICFAIRPERLKIKPAPADRDSYFKAKYKESIYIGSTIKTIVTLANGRAVTVSAPAGEAYDLSYRSEELYVTWNPENAVVIKE
ncbi:Spermidine/putrescine import ATP-binding protein PotA [Clostridium sp. N3C]|uniref:ABC transporter ATP-binding protein n=1 Tax=Clostridium sp. N3C TaxID=1776758 RepID=UPI00092DF6A2|nr:Spermidine/putrescine import ATP-binding protein PotA [Clostridium sp. N3C]